MKGAGKAGSGISKLSRQKPKALNSDEAVPMFKYGPYNNFVVFKE
jgi:hypothetical protein